MWQENQRVGCRARASCFSVAGRAQAAGGAHAAAADPGSCFASGLKASCDNQQQQDSNDPWSATAVQCPEAGQIAIQPG